ncbi:MAG: EF-hand domain-containing protein [Chakrabartia sp.]
MTRFVLVAGIGLLAAAPLAAQPMAMDMGDAGMRAKMAAPMTRANVEADAQARFAEMDANKDGVVTREEAEAARLAMHKAMADKMFDMMDADKDGSISRAEFAAHHQGMGAGHERGHGDGATPGAPAEARGNRMFERADANKDGKVTLAEARAAALDQFDKMDLNKDGKVTMEERHTAWQKMRAEKQDPHAGH